MSGGRHRLRTQDDAVDTVTFAAVTASTSIDTLARPTTPRHAATAWSTQIPSPRLPAAAETARAVASAADLFTPGFAPGVRPVTGVHPVSVAPTEAPTDLFTPSFTPAVGVPETTAPETGWSETVAPETGWSDISDTDLPRRGGRRHSEPAGSWHAGQSGRLMIASVLLAVLGGATWVGIARTRTQVRPDASPAPATAAPTAPGAVPPVVAPPLAPAAPKPAPPSPAVGPINLAGWKLTIPEASEKGTAANVNPAKSTSPWMTQDVNGGLKFWAPVDGATTPNSKHPRTELDSLHNFKAGTSPHTLSATVSVAQAPSGNQDIIIGQIHGADDISSVPFVMLHYTAGAIRVVVKEAQSGPTSDKYPLITGVPLGARFSYTITDAGNGNVVFSATYGANTRQVTIAIPEPFRGATVRFQAGAYQQGESSSGTSDGARITFHSLREQTTAAP